MAKKAQTNVEEVREKTQEEVPEIPQIEVVEQSVAEVKETVPEVKKSGEKIAVDKKALQRLVRCLMLDKTKFVTKIGAKKVVGSLLGIEGQELHDLYEAWKIETQAEYYGDAFKVS